MLYVSKLTKVIIPLFLFFLFLIYAKSTTRATEYTLIDLGPVIGNEASSANGINDAGVIVGHTHPMGGLDHIYGTPNNHAFIWNNGVVTELPSISGVSDNVAWDVNNRSQVVGISGGINDDSHAHAVLWENGIANDLGTYRWPELSCSYTNEPIS